MKNEKELSWSDSLSSVDEVWQTFPSPEWEHSIEWFHCERADPENRARSTEAQTPSNAQDSGKESYSTASSLKK